MGFYVALMTTVNGAPVAALVLLGAVGVLTARRLRSSRVSSVEPYLLALCCACVGVVTYGVGFAYASFIHAGPDRAVCPAGKMQPPSTHEALLPLAHDCVYVDGRVVSLVPGLINPLLLVSTVACLAFLVGARYVGRRGRRVADAAVPLPASGST